MLLLGPEPVPELGADGGLDTEAAGGGVGARDGGSDREGIAGASCEAGRDGGGRGDAEGRTGADAGGTGRARACVCREWRYIAVSTGLFLPGHGRSAGRRVVGVFIPLRPNPSLMTSGGTERGRGHEGAASNEGTHRSAPSPPQASRCSRRWRPLSQTMAWRKCVLMALPKGTEASADSFMREARSPIGRDRFSYGHFGLRKWEALSRSRQVIHRNLRLTRGVGSAARALRGAHGSVVSYPHSCTATCPPSPPPPPSARPSPSAAARAPRRPAHRLAPST